MDFSVYLFGIALFCVLALCDHQADILCDWLELNNAESYFLSSWNSYFFSNIITCFVHEF